MAKSRKLAIGQVRAVHRLIDECREVGDDIDRWRKHLLTGVKALIDVPLASASETDMAGKTEPIITRYCIAAEVAPVHVQRSEELMRGCPSATATPLGIWFASWVLRRRAAEAFPAALSPAYIGRRNTALVRDTCPTSWHKTALFQEWLRPHDLDDGLMSVHGRPDGWAFVITSGRVCGDRPFERRHTKLIHFLQLTLASHLGRSLATSRDPVARLSPRQRQTLDCLLDGDGEKQAALRMGISTATVREYVQTLYRHFEVNSRAELMAYFLRRYRNRPQT